MSIELREQFWLRQRPNKEKLYKFKDFGFYFMSCGKPLELLSWSMALTGLILENQTAL